jgi:hypothetical protein
LAETELEEWKARLQEVDCTVLPTTRDQWVTLGNDAGFACVCDDEKIGEEFAEDAEGLNFLCLKASQFSATSSMSSPEERCSRVKRFYASLGIPLLSQVSHRSFNHVNMVLRDEQIHGLDLRCYDRFISISSCECHVSDCVTPFTKSAVLKDR